MARVQRAFAATFGLLAVLMTAPIAHAQANVDQAKVALDKAKADLDKAYDAYLRAVDGYVAATRPATPAPTPAPTPSGPPQRSVSFAAPKAVGVGVMPVYQARLVSDGKASGWTYVRPTDPGPVALKAAPAKTLSYEVQSLRTTGGMGGPPGQTVATTICNGNLAIKDATAIAIDLGNKCTVK